MNEEAHWNQIANNYNQEIFDVFASDKNGLLPKYFRKHANRNSTAIDFGCGNGKAFSYLSPLFKEVIAIDISKELIAQARKSPFKNISFLRKDLSRPTNKLPKADFIFSCNVIMLPELEKNYAMLANIQKSLNQGGRALIVVPSEESILFSAWRLVDWYKREGSLPKEIPASELSYFKGTKLEIIQGIFYIDGVATKHYSQPEIEVMFKDLKLKVTAIEKLAYGWDTEFDSPPAWMGSPYPWDWLLECSR